MLAWSYLEQVAGRRPLYDYMIPIAINENKEHELAYFLIVICYYFKKIHRMVFRMDSWLALEKSLEPFVSCD